MKIKEAIKELIELKSLGHRDAYEVALEIMSGGATDAQIACLLTALRIKGETVNEITGFAQAMREKVTRVICNSEYLVDTCGTGGDGTGTFNISTISAFVAAGAGCHVAKHGNRAVSSRCGSADLLERMGIKIEMMPEKMAECVDRAGIGFLFAPLLHQAMKYAIGPRREMGIRTIFNILGPLTNPAGSQSQILGVFDQRLNEPIANVLKNLGGRHCMVVHGEDGLDEITITGKTFISELCHGKIDNYTIEPADFGIASAPIEGIQGGNIEDNTAIAFDVLNRISGPKRDIVTLNAGAAIYVAGKANSLAHGIELAKESIDSGRARAKVELLKELTR